MAENTATPEPSMDEILASVRRILAEDEQVAGPRLAMPLRAARDDVLDLTEALNDDGTIRHIEPVELVSPELPARAPDGRIEPAVPDPESIAAGRPLISDAVSDAVAASFAQLSSLSREGGERPLDEMVQETLRPLLQAWLDEHLPALVERLVRAEIARVVGSRPLAP
jgi:cell pole-organizing protein PopZ